MSDRNESDARLDSDDERALAAELDIVMATCLEPLAPSTDLLARLQNSVSRPPQRYAPFFAKVAELFDLSEARAIAELARLAEPRAWSFAGLPGVRNIMVHGGPRVAGAETVFARFAPGTRFPSHRHAGAERVLVLEGEYIDSTGIVHRAGELRDWAPGSTHAFRVGLDEPCIFASAVFGREFSSLPLRWLARALAR
jgi:quercetin dioxygenase-like cupin family protein